MLNSTLRQCRGLQFKTLLHHTNINVNSRRKLLIPPQLHTCLCRHRQDFYKNARLHSTQSDQHRQKVIKSFQNYMYIVAGSRPPQKSRIKLNHNAYLMRIFNGEPKLSSKDSKLTSRLTFRPSNL